MRSKRFLSKKTKYIKGGTKKDKKEPKEKKEKMVKTVKKRPKLIIVEEFEKIPALLQNPSANIYLLLGITLRKCHLDWVCAIWAGLGLFA